MTDQTPDPWECVELCVRNPYIDAEEAWRVVDAALAAERAQHQQEIVQRDETIRQLQDAFARCQEVQQATAETWRIEHDQMAEQIRLLRGAMAADDERLRRAAEQAGILYVSCDTAEALAEQIARLSAEVEEQRSFEILMIKDATRLEAARDEAVSEAATLRAERDAAQQQIATLTQELSVSRANHIDANQRNMQSVRELEAAEARCATLTAALDEYDRIDACSPTTPWCDAPGYVNAEHYDGHPAAKRELIAKMRAALSGVPTL